MKINKYLQLLKLIANVFFILILNSTVNGQVFDIQKTTEIVIDSKIIKDDAINLCSDDLASSIMTNTGSRIFIHTPSRIKPNSILLVLSENTISQRPDSLLRLSEESFFLQKKVVEGQPVLVITGGSIRGICYGVYYVREQLNIQNYLLFQGQSFYRNPDFKFRMITQPFEVTGFSNVAYLPKPIISERQYGPMRPFNGRGYKAEDEAKNILRSGLNTIYYDSYTFATTYHSLSDTIFPQGSEGRKWVDECRGKLKEMILAARKYHLKVCVNSDVFAYPRSCININKWVLLECSINEILTDFPEIDYVIGRFGENYSFFNPYFTGEGPKDNAELINVLDRIYDLAVNKYHKIFIPRTWSMGNHVWHSNQDLYKAIINNVQADSSIYFSVKNTQTDFWRYNRFNPTIGVGNKKQAIEYLCQDGYHFKCSVPYYEVMRMSRGSKEIDSVETGMKRAKALGIDYTWGWLSADGWCGPYIKREEWLKANIFGFTHLMWNVNESPEELARRWACIEFKVPYDSKAADEIADILLISEEMILKAVYFNHFSLMHNGWLPALNWTRDDLLGGGDRSFKNQDCKFSSLPGKIKEIFSSEYVDADCLEKQYALKLAEQMVTKFEGIKSTLPDKTQAEEVFNALLSTKYLIATICYYINGMFRYYNGENEQAEKYLLKWRETWYIYNNEISLLPGAPTPMIDGGMVETCKATLHAIEQKK